MRTATTALALFLLLAGCGGDEPPAGSPRADGPATAIDGPGSYEAGVDIPPGTYIADGIDPYTCFAYTSTSEDHDLEAPQDGEIEAIPAPVGADRVQFDVAEGQFLHVLECDATWERADAASADPSTTEGACAILTEEAVDAVLDVLDAGRAPGRGFPAFANGFFTVVVGGHPQLSDPAGQFIDFLEDPASWSEHDELSAEIEAGAKTVERTCGY